MSRTVTVRVTRSFTHRGRALAVGHPVEVTPKEAIALARSGHVSLTRVLPDAPRAARALDLPGRVLRDRNLTVRTPKGEPPAAAPTASDPQPPPGTPSQSPAGDQNHNGVEDTKERRPRRGGRARRTGADAPEPEASVVVEDQQYERSDFVGSGDSDDKS